MEVGQMGGFVRHTLYTSWVSLLFAGLVSTASFYCNRCLAAFKKQYSSCLPFFWHMPENNRVDICSRVFRYKLR